MIELKHQGWVSDARFASDGRLITADIAGAVRVWDLERGELDHELTVEGAGHAYAVRRVAAAMSPDGRRLAVAATAESRVRFYDLASSTWAHELPVQKPVHDLAYTASGGLLVGTFNGGLQFFHSVEAGAAPRCIGSKTAKVLDMIASPIGVVCLRYGYRLWRSFDLEGELPEQAHRQFERAACSDEAIVFGDGQSIHIRRRRRHRKRTRVRGLRAVAVTRRHAFAAAESSLLTFSMDGELLEESPMNLGDASAMAMSPDGRFMVTWVGYEPHRRGAGSVQVHNRGYSATSRVIATAAPSRSETELPPYEPVSVTTPVALEQDLGDVLAGARVGDYEVTLDTAGVLSIAGMGLSESLGFEPTRASLLAVSDEHLLVHVDAVLELRAVPSLELLQRVRVHSRRARISAGGGCVAVLEPTGVRLMHPSDLGRVVGSVHIALKDDSPIVDFSLTHDDRVIFVRRNGELAIADLAGAVSTEGKPGRSPRVSVIAQLPREVSRIEVLAGNEKARVGVIFRDRSAQKLTVALPTPSPTRVDIDALVAGPLVSPLADEVRSEIERLGGRLEHFAQKGEATYPDGVFPLPLAVRQLFGVQWPAGVAFETRGARAWNGIVSPAPTLHGLDFSVRGVAPLMGRVRVRTLQQIRLICFARSEDGLMTIDIGADPVDPVVYLVNESTGERTRLLRLSAFFERLQQTGEVEESGVRRLATPKIAKTA